MQEKKRSNGILSAVICRVTAVMLLVTLISCHVISGTVAKYVTSKQAEGDHARVASFSVEAMGDEDNVSSLNLEYGNSNASKSYKITVTNNSEVAVRYTLSITFESDVAGYLTAKVGVTDGLYSDGTFTWASDELAVGEEKKLILTLTAGDSIANIGEGVDTAHEEYQFETSVQFEQII